MGKIQLKKQGMQTDYLKILPEQGEESYITAGSQRWWKNLAKSDKILNYRDFHRDESYRIWQMGCGLIAVIDAQLYMEQHTQEELDQETYRRYVEENQRSVYRLPGDLFHYYVGLFPGTMIRGLKKHFRCIQRPDRNAKWAPYFWSGRKQGRLVLEAIREMLEQDFPVIFSYHAFRRDEWLVLYQTPQKAMCGDSTGGKTVNSHYMTIIGMEWDEEKGFDGSNVILKVVSWGKVYYFFYEVLERHLSLFTNILRISDKK